MTRKKATRKLRIVLHIVFFDGNPTLSWNAYVFDGQKEVMKLIDGRHSYDEDILKVVETFELLGAEVIASRFRAGKWTDKKPWRWFNRFKNLGVE